ncbi:MAG TPA: lysophospholipid acyltransferase family protein [Chitinophagaceae bacterium]|nr:lysophospholipid acyltransferase family protein [Chitinophagaceae bacterium]
MKKRILQFTYSIVLRNFLKIFVGVQFHKAKFLIDEKQFIIVANHNSHLDTMALMASLPSKIIHKVRPVAAADHFGKTKRQARMSNFFINSLLIPRKRDKDHPGEDPVNKMLAALDEGYSLILFPEGTRGEPEKLQPLKPGIGIILSKRPHIKYVPVFMNGMGKAMPKGDNLIVPYTAKLVYGKPTEIKSTDVAAIVKQVEDDLLELKDKVNLPTRQSQEE